MVCGILSSAHDADRREEGGDFETTEWVSTEKAGYVRALGNVQFDHRKMDSFEIWRFLTAENGFLGKKKVVKNRMSSKKMVIIEEILRNIAQ